MTTYMAVRFLLEQIAFSEHNVSRERFSQLLDEDTEWAWETYSHFVRCVWPGTVIPVAWVEYKALYYMWKRWRNVSTVPFPMQDPHPYWSESYKRWRLHPNQPVPPRPLDNNSSRHFPVQPHQHTEQSPAAGSTSAPEHAPQGDESQTFHQGQTGEDNSHQQNPDGREVKNHYQEADRFLEDLARDMEEAGPPSITFTRTPEA